jgi:uncharacterized protein (TIGR02145 family)
LVESGNGTNNYGFAALPTSDSEKREWWSSYDLEELQGQPYAWYFRIYGQQHNTELTYGGGDKNSKRSVRCVMD